MWENIAWELRRTEFARGTVDSHGSVVIISVNKGNVGIKLAEAVEFLLEELVVVLGEFV